MQLPARAGQELSGHPNRFAAAHLLEVAEMGLHREVAVAAGDVVGARAKQFHGPVAGLREQFQVVGFIHVAVVVGPALRDLARRGDRKIAGAVLRRRQAALMGGDRPARAVVVLAQGAHDGHQIVVPQALQLPYSAPPGLAVGLRRNSRNQLRGQLRHLRQPRPVPLQRRPELRDEVRHSGIAAGNPVGLEQAHLRPPQAEAEAYRIIDLAGGGYLIPNQPQRFSPHRLQQSVGDVGGDFLADEQRLHADAAQQGDGLIAGPRAGRRGGDHLHQRQEIYRIERMTHQNLARPPGAALQL